MKTIFFLLAPCVVFAKSALLSLGVGDYNITGTRQKWLYQVEYRFKPPVYDLRPQVGIFVTEQLVTFLYGGIGYDIFLGKRAVLTPAFCPGWYNKGGGKNLGFPLEFRSSAEFAFLFERGDRVGITFSHLSNAHLSHRNPGVNTLVLSYEISMK